jgi:preprotein translocase SecE subunit
MAYKPEQGRVARTAAFWSLALLIVYGCTSLDSTLETYFPNPFGKVLGGASVPILSWKVTLALIVSVVVFVLGIWGLHRYLDRPKVADLLIETESELRKVTWPTMNEAVNSSVVVIVCVLFLMLFLAGADWWLGKVVTYVLLGGG